MLMRKKLKRKAQIAMNKNVSRSRIWYGAKSYHVLYRDNIYLDWFLS